MTRSKFLLCRACVAAVTLAGTASLLSAQNLPSPASGAGEPPAQPASGPAKMGGNPQAPEPSSSLTVTVEGRSQTLTMQQIEAMPQKNVTAHNGHTNQDESYTGVTVSDLLARAGFDASAKQAHRQLLHSYLRATGTDFYYVLYSAVEVEGSFHAGDVIVATRRNGQPLKNDGKLMLISTGDKQPARWVHNLMSLTLSSVE